VINATPERATRFVNAMTYYNEGEDISLDYPFGEMGSGTLVDVGGSRGTVAFKIAKRFPDLKIVVQDVPFVVDDAKERKGVNVSFMVHDFWKEQPLKGADGYMIRWCLHDWSDPYCIKILRGLIPALKPGAKLLVIDSIVPPFGALPRSAARMLQ
jgi:hypothetical protein